MKKSFWESAQAVMEEKGFYIVLLLSAAALGVSGYFLFTGTEEPKDRPVSGAAQVVVTPSVGSGPEKPTGGTHPVLPMQVPQPVQTGPAPVTASEAVPTVAEPEQPEDTQKPEEVKSVSAPVTATASVFTWPVKGAVLRGFEVEALAYDTTMGDWRTHDGVDIAAEVGTQVRAPAGGTVSYVGEDDFLGLTVAILHADGVMSTCANLGGAPAVELGDTVLTGDVIGTVGETALAESGEEAHLHLSMTRNGISVDPMEYLPQK